MTCKARRQQDQMVCGRCGLAWDIDDDDPPACLTVAEIAHRDVKKLIDGEAESLRELRKIVNCALDNSEVNGFDLKHRWSANDIARDLIKCCGSLECYRVDELTPFIIDWQSGAVP